MIDFYEIETKYGAGTYAKQELAIVRGQGAILFDADGVEYLDCTSGHGVANLGHAHPKVVPIVGVKCAIDDGQSHPVDSSEIAFRTAALMGFREAYNKAKPTILEPMMLVEVQFPEEFQGAVIGQLNQRRGAIISTEKHETYVQALTEVPLADMFGYSTDLRSATQGKGEFSMEFKRYAELPKQQREAMVLEFRTKKEKEAGTSSKRAAG